MRDGGTGTGPDGRSEANPSLFHHVPQIVRGRKFVRVFWGKWSLTLGWMGPL